MKIAFICQPWTVARPTLECDSIGIWTYQVARRLNQKAKILFYGGQKYDAPPVYNHEGIEYRGIKLGFDKFTKVFEYLDLWQLTAPQKPFFASTFYYSNYIKKIAKDLQKQQCDLIHIHNFSQFVPIIKTFNPNSKIVLHMHCEWLTQLDWQTIEKRLNLVDLVIGCSDYITDKIIKHFPHLATRFVSVANGVDTDLFFPKNRDYQQQKNKELLYVGRISPEKGLHVLLEAFQKVAQQQPNVNLKILGGKAIVPAQFLVRLDNNPEVKALIRFYQQSQDYLEYLYSQITPALAKKISFIGALSQIELVDYYRQADLLINPALSEAFGMSLIEAMATGIPVIGAKIGGMNNVISEGEVGLFFKSAEPDSLATAILKLLDDDCTRKTMGLAGRQRVLSLFSWERVSENLWDYYQNLLESE